MLLAYHPAPLGKGRLFAIALHENNSLGPSKAVVLVPLDPWSFLVHVSPLLDDKTLAIYCALPLRQDTTNPLN